MKKVEVDTPWKGSWAEQMSQKAFPPPGPSQLVAFCELDQLMLKQGFRFLPKGKTLKRTWYGNEVVNGD